MSHFETSPNSPRRIHWIDPCSYIKGIRLHLRATQRIFNFKQTSARTESKGGDCASLMWFIHHSAPKLKSESSKKSRWGLESHLIEIPLLWDVLGPSLELHWGSFSSRDVAALKKRQRVFRSRNRFGPSWLKLAYCAVKVWFVKRKTRLKGDTQWITLMSFRMSKQVGVSGLVVEHQFKCMVLILFWIFKDK